jgi:hypothetical protein
LPDPHGHLSENGERDEIEQGQAARPEEQAGKQASLIGVPFLATPSEPGDGGCQE